MTRASLFYQKQKRAALAHAGGGHEQTVKLVGVTRENCPQVVARLKLGERLALHRQPDNPFDPNAIGVYTAAGEKAGYIPKDLAALLAPVMDAHGGGITAVVQGFQGDPTRGQSRGVTIRFRSPANLPPLEQLPEELDV